MPLNRMLIRMLCVSLLAASPGAVLAGNFNCAVVYDEFESLMNRRFLMQPDEFVRTQQDSITLEQFEGVADADFHLYPNRDGMGIGVLVTNQNIHAKFLFHWSQPMVDDTRHVIIDEVVKYGRVASGQSASRFGPFRLKPGMSVDIDNEEYVPTQEGIIEDPDLDSKRQRGDLLYELQADAAVLRAVNDARVQFPLETLCSESGT